MKHLTATLPSWLPVLPVVGMTVVLAGPGPVLRWLVRHRRTRSVATPEPAAGVAGARRGDVKGRTFPRMIVKS